MARPAKEPFKLADGRTTPVTLQKRGAVYRVKFKNPEGKFVVVTTGRSDSAGAWAEAGKIVLAAFSPTMKPDLRKGTWPQVLAELPLSTNGKQLRERSLEAYTSRINVFRELMPTSKGPHDVTAEVAQQFLDKYQFGTFTKSKKPDAKQFTRSATTVETTLRVLSGLWGHLVKMKMASFDPWEGIDPPEVPKVAPTAPTEKDIDQFFEWIDSKRWELMSVFFRVKALACCRTNDVCQILSDQFDAEGRTLTITHGQDKTNRERVIPLPVDLAARLDKLRGETYLWERYAAESQTYRPGRRNAKVFTPGLMYWAVQALFPAYRKAHPKRPHITAHDLRRRGITLLVKAVGLDRTAEALGIHPDTARKHYLDAKQAFNSTELFEQMAGVLVPK